MSSIINSYAAIIKGHVIDSDTHEFVPAVIVSIRGTKLVTIADANGEYVFHNIPKGTYTLSAKMMGYKFTIKEHINLQSNDEIFKYDLYLRPDSRLLSSAEVSAGAITKATEIGARLTERESPNLKNVVSAKAIELSPDLDVASVVQRMSGVTLEKSTSGGGQYALLRGMDKRYSYTLVNGIKIPSTNDNHRYTSLDIFSSYLQDRIEVQ